MDERFRDYFRQRVDVYERRWGPDFIRRRALSGRQKYPQLVAAEAGQRALRAAREEADDLPDIVAVDVVRVIAQSVEISGEREISAHSIVDGLSASWEQLESSHFRVWDRHRGDRGPDADFRD
ncbi:MAG TPA: hypothetical protein VKG03_04230 [Solirubrobacterales bacterium]|nr:hypothetical protein [Solirubrobacterales bacterium]